MDCKQLTESQCRPPHCVYVNTQKRKYCRKATRKTTSKHVNAKFLQMVCETSGECLSFGSHVHEIHSFFNGFTDFKYVTGSIEQLGEESNNGFIREIKYKRNGYSAFAVLKSTNNQFNDNITYEYHVGHKFINHIINQFPCFVYTYGLFYYNTLFDYFTIRRAPITKGKLFLTNHISVEPTENYKKSCVNAQMACVLIQHLHNTSSFFATLMQGAPFVTTHMTHVLFIVYHALSSLAKVYTHYDLHQDNVLLFRPHPTKTIQYVYHRGGSTITFKCPYVPKIIDYGRCYVNNQYINSKKVYDTLCAIPECGKCGSDYGFTFMDPVEHLGISVQKKNESHDLRLMYNLHNIVPLIEGVTLKQCRQSESYKRLEKVVSKIQYGKDILSNGQPASKDEEEFGTAEDTTLHPKGDIVANVTDAFNELTKIVTHPKVIEENNRLQPDDLIGIFHIYDGRPMEYFRV